MSADELLDDKVDGLLGMLCSALAANFSEEEMDSDARVAVAEEFVEHMGAIMEFLSKYTPTPAKTAALFYVVSRIQTSRVSSFSGKIILTLVEATKLIADSMRKVVPMPELPKEN